MKKYLTVAMILIIGIVGLIGFASCEDKTIEEDKPLAAKTIEIATADELADLNNYLGIKYSNYNFELKNDLDLVNYEEWMPIGTKDKPFMGKFEGNNYTIKNFSYNGITKEGLPKTDSEALSSIALFAYVKNALIENVSLTNVNISAYSSGKYFNIAALVGENSGSSEFRNINIEGNIELSNIYEYTVTYDMNGEIQDAKKIACDTTQRIGGLVSYSAGKSVFENIDVNVSINNNNSRAVYDEGSENETAGYKLNYDMTSSSLPLQVMASGFAGYIKGGAEIKDITVGGEIKANAQTVYAAGVSATAIDVEMTDLKIENIQIAAKGANKVSAAGFAALLDSSVVSDSEIKSLDMEVQSLSSSLSSLTAGGMVAYVYDGSVLEDNNLDEFYYKSSYKEPNIAKVGGLAGAVRESKVIKNSVTAQLRLTAMGKIIVSDYEKIAASVAGAVYGNSTVSECIAYATVVLQENSLSEQNYSCLYKEYLQKENTVYVDEEGHKVARFIPKDSIASYIEVSVSHSENKIDLKIVDNENTQIAAYSININDNDFADKSGEDYEKYLDAYYLADKGIFDEEGEILTVNGIVYDYKILTGVPTIENNIIAIA